jgi:hypothetical protein
MRTIKHVRQDIADNDRAIAALKQEGRTLMATAADKRTPEQDARLAAIEGDIDAKTAHAVALATEHARFEKMQDDQRAMGTMPRVEPGTDHAARAPWGPDVPANASAHVQREVRHIALGNFAMAVRAAALGQGLADPRLHAAATGAGTQTDSNLGFAVPGEIAPGIEREMYTATARSSRRVDTRTVTGNAMTFNVIDETSRADGSRGGGVLGYWVDEGTAPTASNTKLARIEMKLRKVGAFGVMTDELLSDAAALGGELESAFASELIFPGREQDLPRQRRVGPARLPERALPRVGLEGNQPGGGDHQHHEPLEDVGAPARALEEERGVARQRGLRAAAGRALAGHRHGGTAPRFVNYDAEAHPDDQGPPGDRGGIRRDRRHGGRHRARRPVEVPPDSQGRRRAGVSMHVYFSTGEQAFRAFYRVDGQPVPRAAHHPVQGQRTLSPFVVLATR